MTKSVTKQFNQSSLDSIMQELTKLSEQQQLTNSTLCESLSKDDFKNQLEIMETKTIAKFYEKENVKLKIENTK